MSENERWLKKVLIEDEKPLDPFNHKVNIAGELTLSLYDEWGNLKQEEHVHNLVTTVGLTHIADQMASSPGEAAMGWMAVGTNGTGPAAGDLALGAEVGSSRTALSARTHLLGVVTYTCTFSAGVGTGALVEAGIFNAAAAGILLCRAVYTVINKGAADSLAVTWTLTFTDDGV